MARCSYIDFIRSEADILAVAELKGDEETMLPYHNRTRILHPELQKFKLEKQASTPCTPGLAGCARSA
jgi:hypothetical protein